MSLRSTMTYEFDPEVGAALAAAAEQREMPPAPERGDWQTLRSNTNALMSALAEEAPTYPDVRTEKYSVNAADGTSLELRWYTKGDERPGSAVVYAHGGGMICGDLDIYDSVVAAYVSASAVPFLAVEYRLAPEYPGTAPAEDTFAAIQWLAEHAAELQVDASRIAIMGDSGGGGVAAGAAIIARDRGLQLASQILIYPMLDDRNITADPNLEPFAVWTYDNNYTGWHALLGEDLASDRVPAYAAPARNDEFGGLAPAYIEVGELDIFRDESIEYAHRLSLAGVSVELHVHRGAPHGFERLAPAAKVTERSTADRLRTLRGL